jgi:hypothetical protein
MSNVCLALDQYGNRFVFSYDDPPISKDHVSINVLFPACKDKLYTLNLKTNEYTFYYVDGPDMTKRTYKFTKIVDFLDDKNIFKQPKQPRKRKKSWEVPYFENGVYYNATTLYK